MRESLRAAGQRVAVGFSGLAASAEVKDLIRTYGVGSVVLFGRNVETPEQVSEVVSELQSVARAAGHDRPLLVATDQEGGRVARLRDPWTVWPPARALGATGSASLAERMGRAMALELRASGILFDLAPVVDVDTNPANPVIGDRALSGEPDLVGRLGAAFIRGLQGGGVAACAKHFPGHGDTKTDSHKVLPVVEHSRKRLEDVELRPFRAAIEAGVSAILLAHLLVREYDETLPSSLSSAVVQVLRKELGFTGVIVADDLEMQAVAATYPPGEAARLAAVAGCDLLLVCATPESQVASVEALVRAMEQGEIPFQAVEDAEKRLSRLKERYLLPYADPDPRGAREAAGRPEHLALAQTIASG